MPCAFVLHLAFPRANLPWLAPLALGALFASWMTLRPAAAAAVGYLAGVIFFALDFSWFGESAGALLGPFGFLLDFAPAAIEAVGFAAAAAIAALAAQRLTGFWVPIAAAAGFTLVEMVRSSGVLGVPLYQVGAAFVDTPLAPLAAYFGVYGLTFSIAVAAAAFGALAGAADRRGPARRLGIIIGTIAIASLAAWLGWPARTVMPGTIRVAAVQGNIRQSVKWQARSLPQAVERYTTLTATLRDFKPAFVLWPETVITTDLLIDPGLAVNPANGAFVASARDLRRSFAGVARSLGTTLAVGSDEATTSRPYNDLIFFRSDAPTLEVYRKRRLVPFAEFLPGPAWLRNLPFASLISDFGSGARLGPFAGELRVAPLICWEAGFGDLAQRQAAAGARFFAIATDDAWFGETDGPYAQAQIAQLRAIETGRWVLRAAATGISGIIGPDGRWRRRSVLDTQAVVTGTLGEPLPTVYSRLGPWPIGAAATLLAALAFGCGRRRNSR